MSRYGKCSRLVSSASGAVVQANQKVTPMKKLNRLRERLQQRCRGAVFVEYLLLVTLVGIGVIVGLATLRGALINELIDLADAINAINS